MSSIFTQGGPTAWAQYTKMLEELVGRTDANTRVQALSVAEIANWDTVHSHYNRFLQCKMADRLGQWAAVGSFAGRSVSSGYLEFLGAIQSEAVRCLPMIERSAVEAAGRRVTRLRDDASNLESEISRRWTHHRRDMDAGRVQFATRREFEEQRGIPIARARIARELAMAERGYDALARRIGGDVGVAGEALLRYHSKEYGIALPEQPEDDVPALADGWPVFRDQGLAGDIAAFKRDTRRLALTLADGCTELEARAASWDSCTGIVLPYWSISGGSAGSSFDEPTSRQTLSVTLAFENIASFGIWRGQWYQPALLDSHGAVTPGPWGRDGYLNVIPTAFILSRGLTVTAAMSSEVKTYAQRTFDAGGSIRVGPFTFGGGGGSATIRSTCETTRTGLRIVDTSGRALVVGLTAVCH